MEAPLVLIHLFNSDFPWNKPSSYWGIPIYGNPHIYPLLNIQETMEKHYAING